MEKVEATESDYIVLVAAVGLVVGLIIGEEVLAGIGAFGLVSGLLFKAAA